MAPALSPLQPQPGHTSLRQFTTSLVTELALAQEQSAEAISSSLKANNEDIKHILLSIHALFPDELLPALDILDRKLIRRFSNVQGIEASTAQQDRDTSRSSGLDDSYHLGLTSTNTFVGEDRRHQHHVQDETDVLAARAQMEGASSSMWFQQEEVKDSDQQRYERLLLRETYYVRSGREQITSHKWRDAVSEATAHYEVRLVPWSCSCPAFTFSAFPATQPSRSRGVDEAWQLGGRTRGDDLPICKHILACVLASIVPAYRKRVDVVEVGTEELAGWVAGFGD